MGNKIIYREYSQKEKKEVERNKKKPQKTKRK